MLKDPLRAIGGLPMAAFAAPSLARFSSTSDSTPAHILLPNGQCAFRDLAAGPNPPTCGCRRFWLNTSIRADQRGEKAWCFCGHHACYHENAQQDEHARNVPRGIAGIANALPISHQANTPSQHAAYVPPTWSELIRSERQSSEPQHIPAPAPALAPVPTRSASAAGLGIKNTQTLSHQSASINNRLWQALNGYARAQDDSRLPDQLSNLPSTAVPSLCEEPLAHSVSRDRMGPPVTIPSTNVHDRRIDEYSVTEVGTPSMCGTPDLMTHRAPNPNVTTSPETHADARFGRDAFPPAPQTSRHATQPAVPVRPSTGPSLSIQEMCNTIQDYGQRIEALESVSFTHIPSGEIHEKFDMLDSRTLDLETWRTDLEQARIAEDVDGQDRLRHMDERLQDVEGWRAEQEKSSQESALLGEPSSAAKRRRLFTDTSSIASDGSFDETAAAQTETVVLATLAAHAETGPRIDALESRIVDLENTALPTNARPWHIQVVLLPFGRQLPGLWFSAAESTQHSLRSSRRVSEDWDAAHSMAQASFQSVDSSGAWTTHSIEAWANGTEEDWLSPKACGPNGAAFQRLASRGLVRSITLQAPDAHHVCSAISRAFGSILPRSEVALGQAKATYQALKQPFIPLRKIRRSSRLRFLSRAEMVTPATWNASFLESSAFMRIGDGERRLYLTTPEGYIQPPGLVGSWSWAALRSLPMYDVEGEIQKAQSDGRVVEACWTHNDNLDHPASLHGSFASEASPWEVSSEDEADQEITATANPIPSPPTTRHSRARSSSLPGAASVHRMDLDAVSKRRPSSVELELTADVLEYSPEYITKRRRISTSPELERRGVNFTPRWSREPPSPFMADEQVAARSSQSASQRQRGTTPFAYATPHSHFDSREGDGDAEIDAADVRLAQSDNGEEWEGVQDHENTNDSRYMDETGLGSESSSDEISMENDDDNDVGDEGLTIYKA